MYFTNFPTIDYPYYNSEQQRIFKTARNATLRVKFSEYIKKYKTNFDEYTIRDSERPDTLADRLYERSDLHWIFYIINDVINPYYSWPMSNTDLQAFIDEKYKGSGFFVPKIWKDKNTHDLFVGNLSQVGPSTGFSSVDIKGKYINTLSKGDTVKISIDGSFYETEVLDINNKFYEVSLERKSWNPNIGTNRYLYYEVDIFGVTNCVRIPVTRLINQKRYSAYQFEYNSEYRDPQMIFSEGTFTYDESPYNFFIFPFNSENLADGNFANALEANRSFADVFAIADDDGLYMDSSYYKTNEEFELELNESKRNILVPKPRAVEEILKQMKEIFEG